MKRTLLALALASTVVTAPVALAMPGHANGTTTTATTSSPGRSGTATTSSPGRSGITPTSSHDGSGTATTSSPGRRGAAVVSFVLRGTVSGAPTGASFTVALKGMNGPAKKALDGATSFAVLTDANTHFSKAGVGAAAFANIEANDRVVVTIRAKRSTDATGLALVAASRVVDQGPKSA